VTAEALLLIGVTTTVAFYSIMVIEGQRRPGYDWTYHTGSELEIGDGGWIMRANFVVMAAGMAVYAAGIHDAMDTVVAAVFLGVFALGNLIAGVFIPDPVRGFPPDAPTPTQRRAPRLGARIHDVAGPVMFLSLFGACVAVAAKSDGWLATYSVVTAIIGLGLTVWTALAYQRDATRTGLVQRGLLGTYYTWIVVVGLDLTV